MGNDIAGITAFGQDADFFSTIRQIIAQVNTAIAVPDKFFNIFRRSGEVRFIHHRDGSLAEPDNHLHLALF